MEERKEEGALAKINVTDISNNIFGQSNVKKITSLDLTNEDEADMLLSSIEDCDHILNEEVGKGPITVIGCYIIEREVEEQNEETGEVVMVKKHTLMLFDENGESHVTGSNACYMSFMNIVMLKGMPTKEKPIKVEQINKDAKEKGHSYLKLKLVK